MISRAKVNSLFNSSGNFFNSFSKSSNSIHQSILFVRSDFLVFSRFSLNFFPASSKGFFTSPQFKSKSISSKLISSL